SCLKCADAFFYGAFCDQPVYKDGFVLADSPGAVCGLLFGCGVPPGVVVDNAVGCGEVEAGATGFQADEEDRAVAILKPFDGGGAVFGLAGECFIAYAGLFQ